jgi:hypothetical protein
MRGVIAAMRQPPLRVATLITTFPPMGRFKVELQGRLAWMERLGRFDVSQWINRTEQTPGRGQVEPMTCRAVYLLNVDPRRRWC